MRSLRYARDMANEDGKRRAALAAMKYVEPGTIIGVGTGTTVAYFIEALGQMPTQIAGAVSSSEASSAKLRDLHIPIVELGDHTLALYVDGADEVDPNLCLIKGGGGALTREKIIAAAAKRFVCIADPSKCVEVLGTFPLPIEVIPMAEGYVSHQLSRYGTPKRRANRTDNGNVIVDLHGMRISDPIATERELNQIVGVVTVGLFAARRADELLTGA
jgi:ribose 5-phosphate isomerase A